MRIWPGSAYPLGASFDGKGANFAIYSENAISVTLLLYESEHSPAPRERIPLTEKTGHVWHSYLPDVLPGQLYAFSADGPYEPEKGLRFNKNKALIDPYARAITGSVRPNDEMFGYKIGDPSADIVIGLSRFWPLLPQIPGHRSKIQLGRRYTSQNGLERDRDL